MTLKLLNLSVYIYIYVLVDGYGEHMINNLRIKKRAELLEMEDKFDSKRKQGVIELKQLIRETTQKNLEEQTEDTLSEAIQKLKTKFCKISPVNY